METLIALSVMTVLISGFLAVFGPATASLKRAFSIEEANRLQSTLEREFSMVRAAGVDQEFAQGGAFEKAFDWIEKSNESSHAIILYQYRGDQARTREDGTFEPHVEEGIAGEDFLVVPMARRVSDPLLKEDLEAVSGRVFAVTMTQLVFDDGEIRPGEVGQVVDPHNHGDSYNGDAENFPEAVVAFEASFYLLPTVSYDYISNLDLSRLKKAAFKRPMAARR